MLTELFQITFLLSRMLTVQWLRISFSTLQSKDVSFNKLVEQAYDGASNTSGCYNGLQALVHKRINSNAIMYTVMPIH